MLISENINDGACECESSDYECESGESECERVMRVIVNGEDKCESGEDECKSGESDCESSEDDLRAGGTPGTGAKFKSEPLHGVGMEPCDFPTIFSFFSLITSLPEVHSVAWR